MVGYGFGDVDRGGGEEGAEAGAEVGDVDWGVGVFWRGGFGGDGAEGGGVGLGKGVPAGGVSCGG